MKNEARIFLTGATGFLGGAFLASPLLIVAGVAGLYLTSIER